MPNIAELISPDINSQYIGPAVVMGNGDDEGIIKINIKSQQECDQGYARIAIPLSQPLAKGDKILVAGANIDDLYIIGLLSVKQPQAKCPQRRDIGNGAYITIDESNQLPSLQVFSKRNELLVEYDPESEKVRINVEKGNLEFTTQNGDIVFDSQQNIRLNGQTIELASRSNVQLSVSDALGQLISSLSIRPKRLQISSAEVDITAQKSQLNIKQTHYFGKLFRGNIEDSKLIVGKLTTIAKSITEKAKNVYRSVEELTQLKAGRMRTLIRGTSHMKAKTTYMKAEKDFKINADKIHLG